MKTFHYRFNSAAGDFCIYFGKYEDGGKPALFLFKKKENGLELYRALTCKIGSHTFLDLSFPEGKRFFKDMGLCNNHSYNMKILKRYEITQEELNKYEITDLDKSRITEEESSW